MNVTKRFSQRPLLMLIILMISTLILVNSTSSVSSIATMNRDSPLSPSLDLLGSGSRWAAKEGTSALVIDWKTNIAANPNPYAPTQGEMDKWHDDDLSTLTKYGFTIEFAAEIPENMTDYDLVLMQAYYALEPRHEPILRNYINNGGGLVLWSGSETYLVTYCKDFWIGVHDLTAIQEWFGAGTYFNDGGIASISVDNPFGLSLIAGETILESNYNNAAIGSLHVDDTNVMARWSSGSVFAYCHEYGEGRVYYQALQGEAPPPPPVTLISVNPASVQDVQGSNFTVNIDALNVTDLYAFDVKLRYDPSLLQVLDIVEGPFLAGGGNTSVFKNETDNIHGSLWFVVTLLSTPQGVSGDGILFSVHFLMSSQNSGGSSLTLQDVLLSDPDGNLISCRTANGLANIVRNVVGDLDGDGKVGLPDLVVLGRAFGSTPGDANWDSRCDLNTDGHVDMLDLGLAARDYGR